MDVTTNGMVDRELTHQAFLYPGPIEMLRNLKPDEKLSNLQADRMVLLTI
jgi:hypothetical protein